MKIFVKAKANAKENKVTPPPLKLIPDVKEQYIVAVKAPPKEGLANEAITVLIAKHFGISRSQVRLVSGATSKNKVFEIKN